MRTPFRCVVVTALALALPGCGDDDGGGPAPGDDPEADAAADERAALSIDLHWDEDEDPDAFSSDSCESAGVTHFEWALLRAGSDEELVGHMDVCHETLDFLGLPPAEYELEVLGFNDDDEPAWSALCNDLTFAGEDVSYECEIPRD